jgi:phosphatidate phosphatase APP1
MKLVLILLFLSFNLSAKLVIISDLDETLRISKTHNYLLSLTEIIKGVKSFDQMKVLFNQLQKDEQADFIYISASYYKFYNGAKWIRKQGFPTGKVYQKPKLTLSSKEFKLQMLEKLFKNGDFDASDNFLFFGDNSSHDEQVYTEFKAKYGLNGDIFIRDIKSKATPFSSYITPQRVQGINYFYTEWQLLGTSLETFMSPSTIDYIKKQYKQTRGVVCSQKYYLKKLLEKAICSQKITRYQCQTRVNREIKNIHNNYFQLQ